MLQNSLAAKQNQPQQSIERPTVAQQTQAFVHGLSQSLNNQHSVTCTPQPSQISFTVSKLKKTLPDPPLVINGKDSSID